MSVRHLVERTIWVSQCPFCDEVKEIVENPPKERLCKKCDVWIPFTAISSTSEEYKVLQK